MLKDIYRMVFVRCWIKSLVFAGFKVKQMWRDYNVLRLMVPQFSHSKPDSEI